MNASVAPFADRRSAKWHAVMVDLERPGKPLSDNADGAAHYVRRLCLGRR